MILGEFTPGCQVASVFTTVTTTGAPTALAGTPAPFLVAYKLLPGEATGFACSTAGITLSRDCGGMTGVNAFSVNTGSSTSFYACGRDYVMVLQGGTVGGTCVSGYRVASFALHNRAGLRPTQPGRTLSVSQSGHAGVNWADVTNCTNATTLSCTTIFSAVRLVERPVVDSCSTVFSAQKIIDRPIVDSSSIVASVTGAVGSVTGAVGSVSGNVGGNVVGSVGSVTSGVTVTTNNDKTGYSLSAAGIACVTSAPIHEPANVPGWPMSVCTALGWLAALSSNCVTQTASRQSVCNRAASSTIASANITCSSTIVHRGAFS